MIMAKRRGKNALIDSIAAQASVKQEPTQLSAISSSNEQLDNKSEYENLTEELAKIPDLNPEFAADVLAMHRPKDEDEMHAEEDFTRLQNFEAAMSDLSSANLKLQSENAALQEENDKYLMKISELTFENAKLNAQIQELSKSAGNGNYVPPALNERTIPNSFDNSNKKNASQHSRGVNYPHLPNNMGYTSWN